MVLTDGFVYIHMPKTGGTFVTEALTRIHAPRRRSRWQRLAAIALPRVVLPRRRSPYGLLQDVEPKHGTCADIPPQHRHKPLLSNVRNPYDWYVSQFEFAWWKRTFEYFPEPNPTPVGWAIEQVMPAFQSDHPDFPDIAFFGFVDLCDRASRIYDSVLAGSAIHESATAGGFGLLTHGFIRYFFRDPEAVIDRLDGDYIHSGRYRADMYPVQFLRTDRLNDDLYGALAASGYARRDIGFVRDLGRILPMGRGRSEDQPWEAYYSSELKAHVREREWVLFEMFPEFDC